MSENTNKTDIQEWRSLIQQFGKEYFILEDMARLGFIKVSEEELATFKKSIKERKAVKQEIAKINKELSKLDDIETIIKKIRADRIERIRKEREVKRVAKVKALEEKRQKELKRRTETPSYLGENVSKGLKYEGENIERLNALGLPIIKNVAEMALAMQLTPQQIAWLSYHRVSAKTDHYNRFEIPKKKGGFRRISAPKKTLRQAQSWIAHQILNKILLHDAATAFRPNHSILDNALKHKQKDIVIKLDLKDFFPSIKFRRVKGLFKSFGYNEAIATVFGLICTDAARINARLGDDNFYVALTDRYLPQGACTSPALTNIICRKMDKRFFNFCQQAGYDYTRYADDIAISFSFPKYEDDKKERSIIVKETLKMAIKIIEEEDFILNESKTQVLHPHQRQVVTGIVVNEKPNISKKDMRNFRSFLHQYDQHGATAMSLKLGKNATKYAHGYWAFINMVNPEKAAKLVEKYSWLRKL